MSVNELRNANGDIIPKRPVLTDEMKRAGALAAVNSGHLSRVDADEAESFANDIAKHYYRGIDGYELSKEMESDGGWDVDSMFVDDMEQVDGYIQEIHRDALKAWGEVHKPVPPYEVGVELSVRSFDGPSVGTIDGTHEYGPATYLVKMAGTADGDTSRRLVEFEDAKLRPVSVGDVVEPIKPDYQLASGCSRYDTAVVISVEPFVLVSHASDMRWGCTVKRENFRIIGKIEGEALDICMRRLGS